MDLLSLSWDDVIETKKHISLWENIYYSEYNKLLNKIKSYFESEQIDTFIPDQKRKSVTSRVQLLSILDVINPIIDNAESIDEAVKILFDLHLFDSEHDKPSNVKRRIADFKDPRNIKQSYKTNLKNQFPRFKPNLFK